MHGNLNVFIPKINEKSVHLVGFIIRIYHDARSPERLYSKNKFDKSVHLVGFTIRIYHDARSPEHHIPDQNMLCYLLTYLYNVHSLILYNHLYFDTYKN